MSKLKEMRESRGIKMLAVADHLGVSRQTYSQYEKFPEAMSVSQAQAVCNFIGCSINDIFLSLNVGLINIKSCLADDRNGHAGGGAA
ncbi:MAG: helix-turn-helix domain-containing protein [Coriobacteriales bacterium]|jgi:putative transcriptional regulator|nr:helix-turn-helix domain-containing protein [Coriobacteriales bacterium]